MFSTLMGLTGEALAAATPEEASRAFFCAAQRYGASYIQTRRYRRPGGSLTSRAHWNAGGVIMRDAPPDWPHSAAFDYVCFTVNPLLGAIRSSTTRYRFSDFAPRSEPRYGEYWEAMGEARIGDAQCATAYGHDRQIASLHLGFADPEALAAAGEALPLAATVLAEKLMSFPAPDELPLPAPQLSARERDAISWVAEGKTDWEISVILGISESTARFHIDNARRKLGGTNRAHAVARALSAWGSL